jgi:adhesin HecA-like repeat protein
VGAAILFDELTVKGVATPKDASFSEVRAKLYGGTVTGSVHLGWPKKGLQLKGTAAVSQIEIGSLLQAVGKPKNMSGKLNANPEFSANAPAADRIADFLRLDTPFDIQNGVLHGVDIGKAAVSLINKDAGKGGETRFDKLSGHLAMDRGTRRLTQLNIASGSLSADGQVTISPKDTLSGRLNATVKAVSVATGAVPLNVAGTLDNPLIYPSGGTVAGAAAGTAVLGPGLGTAVGVRVGKFTEGLTEGLFGKKEGKKEKKKEEKKQ